MAAHAKLSPSASYRWLHCAGSVEANVVEDEGGGNIYAEEGTAAHALLEMCLRLDHDPTRFLNVAIHKEHVVTEEMADAVGQALDYIRSYLARYPKAKLHIEKEVDPAKVLKCKEGHASGTPDVVLDNYPVELVVIDYKHGAGIPVEVGGNTQTLQYIVGFCAQHAVGRYQKYTAVIIQPRSRHEDGPVRPHHYTHDEVAEHAQRLRKRVIHIAKHPHERTAGDWCRWCRAAGTCRALAQANLAQAQVEFGETEEQPVQPNDVTRAELAQLMRQVPIFEAWLKAVYAEAFRILQRGQKLPGFKLVHGRTSRSWGNERAVAKALLALGFKPDEIAPRSLLGIPGIESLLRKAKKAKNVKGKLQLPGSIARHIKRGVPPLHVAPEEDPRAAVTRGSEFHNH